MAFYTSYHTHNLYCDGSATIGEMVTSALAQRLAAIGISSHSPVPFDTYYAMRLEQLPAYRAEVLQLREQYAGQIDVLLGLELDYLPELEAFYRTQVLPLGFDYVIGSVHYVGLNGAGRPWPIDESRQSFEQVLAERWNSDVRALLAAYYELTRRMAALPEVTIIGHMDRIKRWDVAGDLFDEQAPWYVAEVETTLEAFARHGKIVELNTAYGRLPLERCYPSPWVLRRCVQLDIPLVITGDAHAPVELAGRFDEAYALLREVGCRAVMVLEQGQWHARKFDLRG